MLEIIGWVSVVICAIAFLAGELVDARLRKAQREEAYWRGQVAKDQSMKPVRKVYPPLFEWAPMLPKVTVGKSEDWQSWEREMEKSG